MGNPNGAKGAETERLVAQYLREQGFPEAQRYLREGRRFDMGDIDGVPHTTIQVKYVARPALQEWVLATLTQRKNAGNPLCLLVVRRRNQPVRKWDAYLPTSPVAESEADTWWRMDLRLAVVFLRDMINLHSPSVPSSASTWMRHCERVEGWPSARSTENSGPASPTISTVGSSTVSPATPEALLST